MRTWYELSTAEPLAAPTSACWRRCCPPWGASCSRALMLPCLTVRCVQPRRHVRLALRCPARGRAGQAICTADCCSDRSLFPVVGRSPVGQAGHLNPPFSDTLSWNPAAAAAAPNWGANRGVDRGADQGADQSWWPVQDEGAAAAAPALLALDACIVALHVASQPNMPQQVSAPGSCAGVDRLVTRFALMPLPQLRYLELRSPNPTNRVGRELRPGPSHCQIVQRLCPVAGAARGDAGDGTHAVTIPPSAQRAGLPRCPSAEAIPPCTRRERCASDSES